MQVRAPRLGFVRTPGRTEPEDDTAALIASSAMGDGAAFKRLYDRHAPRLYAVALRITRQPALAADAVHDAMLQVWRNAARYDPARGAPLPWLLSLVRYRALDAVARTRREVLTSEPIEMTDTDPDPLQSLVESSAARALHRCLEGIASDRRSWVVLAFIEGLSHGEVAARVGQPLGTVKSGIRRALMALRTCLDGAPA